MRGRLLLRLIQLRHEPQRHIQILVELRAFDSHVRGHVLLEPAVLQPDDGLDPRTARLAHHAVKIVTMGMQAVWGFLLCRYVIFK